MTRGASYRPNYDVNPQPIRPRVNIDNRQSLAGHVSPQGSNLDFSTRQVDSWRSYRNDTTNLQTATRGFDTSLNPTASTFTPVDQNTYTAPIRSHFTPYQPLRVSNGTIEREIVANTRLPLLEDSHPQFPLQFQTSHRPGLWQHRLRSAGVNSQIQPIPSIEPSETNDFHLPQGPRVLRRAYRASTTPRRTVSPPPAPEATELYRKQAGLKPSRIPSPKKLLVILDLNGTLLYRPSRSSNPTNIKARPGVTALLEYLFSNHVVMVYTSARPENALGMINNLLHPNQRKLLVTVWARDKLDLTKAQYNEKVQVYKKLDKVWADKQIQSSAGDGRRWDQKNTILIDDSHLKALAQPHNLLQVPEYSRADHPVNGNHKAIAAAAKIQQDILKQLELKLEELKWQSDVSQLIRLWQTGSLPIPVVQGQQIVVEENVDQKRMRQAQSTAYPETEPKQLMSPKSPSEADSTTKITTSGGNNSTSGVKTADKAVADLTSMIPGLGRLDDDEDHETQNATLSRSVSPIDESVWQEILSGSQDQNQARGGNERTTSRDRDLVTFPQTPESLTE